MPIYEYKCKKCGVFESVQRISERPLKKCPTCKGKVERLISHSSFVLKGSGWYATDYAKKSPPSETPAASTPAATSDSSASSTPASSTSDTASSASKTSSPSEKSATKAAS